MVRKKARGLYTAMENNYSTKKLLPQNAAHIIIDEWQGAVDLLVLDEPVMSGLLFLNETKGSMSRGRLVVKWKNREGRA